ncbi:MAG: hypothetical protein ABIT38_04730 [Gemmatimonadaceae bacterium]
MSEGNSEYKHSESDKKLDRAADEANTSAQATDAKHRAGPGHDPSKIARHDDAGKDRLFENREQHDAAEKSSEKTRLAKDDARHDHPADDVPADA